MKRALLVPLLLLTVAAPARADEPTNADERADDRAGFSGGPFLAGLGVGVGALAGVQVGRNTLLEAEGRASVEVLPLIVSQLELHAGVRQFLTDTFYLRGGPTLRFAQTRDAFGEAIGKGIGGAVAQGFGSTVVPDDLTEIDHVTDLAFDLALGNRWQWVKLTVACDWVGISWPVTVLSATAHIVHENTGEEVTSYPASDVRRPDLRACFLQIGASW